jgi:enoyl-CoA hydratase/carnithine racemase
MMLYLAADVRLVEGGTRATFGLNEATTGIPLLGGTAGICQYAIPPEHHTELILHGRMIDAEGTHARGVSHELVATAGELLPLAFERARALSDLDPLAYRVNKRILRERAWREAVSAAADQAGEVPTGNVFERIRR